MAEKLEIVVAAKDQASAVLRGLAGTAKASLGAVGTAGNSAKAGLNAMGTAAQGAGVKVGGMGSKAKQAGAETASAFNRMKISAAGYRAEIGMGSIAVAGFAGVAIAGMSKVVKAAMEEAEAEDKLKAAIFASGQAIDSDKLVKLAEARQKVTRYSHEETEAMQAMLINMGFTEDQVVALTPRVQDLSRAFGKDLNTTARLLGVTILKGVNTMSRMGIVIDKTTLQSGDLGAILAVVDARVGNMAENMGKSPTDAMIIFRNEAGELEEELGKALVPALMEVVKVATPVAQAFTALAGTGLGKVLVSVAAGATLVAGAIAAAGAVLPLAARAWYILTGAQLENAIAARAAAAANIGALAAAGGGGAAALIPAAAGGAAAGSRLLPAAETAGAIGVGAASRRLGLGTGLRMLGGAAARFAGPAAIAYTAYEGAKYGIGRWQAGMDTQEKKLSAAADPNSPFMQQWRASRAAAGLPTEPTSAGRAAADAAPQLSPTEQGFAAQGWTQGPNGGWSAPPPSSPKARVTASSPNIDISQQGSETIVRISQAPDPGLLDDQTTDYLDDMAYAGDDF